MPDNLRISTPLPPQEGLNRPSPSSEALINEAVNPSKVTPPNPREQQSNSQSMDLLFGRDSVFGQFVQLFRQTPALSETLEKILLDFSGRTSWDVANRPQESPVFQLIGSLPMEKEEMIQQLAFQQKDATRFSSPLFQLLQQISTTMGDSQFDLCLADFMKSFNGYFSAFETTKSIAGNLENIADRIPKPFAEQLRAAAQKLKFGGAASAVNDNLKVIKEEIIPLLGEYVAKTNDYGKSRDEISMLLHNISTLNVSSKKDLADKFQKLFEYGRVRLNLSESSMRTIQAYFVDELQTEGGRGKNKNEFAQALLSLLSKGVQHDTENIDKNVFRQITRSLLLDNSVYMPFSHYYLPANYMGKFLFSEIWVQKPDPDGNARKNKTAAPPPAVLYLTFDIQDLGYFEASVTIQDGNTDLGLACPAVIQKRSSEIHAGIARILKSNGLAPGEIRLSSSEKPKVPGKILEKIQERMHAIDVTV